MSSIRYTGSLPTELEEKGNTSGQTRASNKDRNVAFGWWRMRVERSVKVCHRRKKLTYYVVDTGFVQFSKRLILSMSSVNLVECVDSCCYDQHLTRARSIISNQSKNCLDYVTECDTSLNLFQWPSSILLDNKTCFRKRKTVFIDADSYSFSTIFRMKTNTRTNFIWHAAKFLNYYL